MSEYCMIDRVARALLAARERRGHGDIDFVDDAYAAIEAMREPTEAMLRAGWKEIDDYLSGGGTSVATPENIYVAMVEAALADGTLSGIAS